MNATELNKLLHSANPPLLLNVLPMEVHEARRIPGSANSCVYEMTFLDQVAGLAPDPSQPVLVYGAGGVSLDAKVAVEKLRSAGYTNVSSFPGGLDEWAAVGLLFEGSGSLPSSALLDGSYAVDAQESVIRWTGRNLFNHHSGILRLASGEIRIASGQLESAVFLIDMNSIACEDLQDAQWNAMLIRHLRDADFFDAERYPIAEFIVDCAEPIPGSSGGTPTHLLKGHITLRGVTLPLEFPAVIASADGGRVTGQGQFELDRTEFGSVYGSSKFFSYLGKHVVNDFIHLHVKVHADSVG